MQYNLSERNISSENRYFVIKRRIEVTIVTVTVAEKFTEGVAKIAIGIV